MTKNVFLYDSFGSSLLKCEYDGPGADGKPRLTIMMPGHPVESFYDYLKTNGGYADCYYLLCEEGKLVETKLIVEMLGQVGLNSFSPFEDMAARLHEVHEHGISFDHAAQELTVKILEVEDKESNKVYYRLIMSVGGEKHYIGEADEVFDNLREIQELLSEIFLFFELEARIPMKKYLEAPKKLKKEFETCRSPKFDYISIW